MPRGHCICGSSNNVRGQGRRREENVEQVDEQINSGKTNERQGSQGRELGGQSERQGYAPNLIISNDNAIDRFSTFNPHQDVKVGIVVAMKIDGIDRHLGNPSCVAKVFSLNQQACENGITTSYGINLKCQEDYKMKKGSSTIGIQIVYNVLVNLIENHMVVFRLVQ